MPTSIILFINTTNKIVEKYGKKVIGWDEVAITEMSDQGFVQFWHSEDNARQGVKKGNKILMSPAKKAYLDMKYNSTTELGLSWTGYIEVDDGYNWDPGQYIEGIGDEKIIGIEAPPLDRKY